MVKPGGRALVSDEEAARFIAANTRLSTHPLVPEVRLHLATEITPIWQASERRLMSQGTEPPFWAFAWPGGAALARYLLDDPSVVSGRHVLDVASGSGIVAIAAALAGAERVEAAEIDPLARTAITINAIANNVAIEAPERDVLSGPAPKADLVLAADVCYEREMAARMTAWLKTCAEAGREVLIADPGRAYLPVTGLAALARYAVPTVLELEDRDSRETVVYRLGA